MVTVKDLMAHFGGGEGEAEGPHLSRAQVTRLIRRLPGAEKVPGPPGRLAKWQAPMTIGEAMDYFEEHPEIFEDAVRERPRGAAAAEDDLNRESREIGGLDNELRAVKKEELEAQRMEARAKRLEAEEKVERIERRRDGGDKDRGELATIFQGQAEALRTLIEKQGIGLKDLLPMLNNRGADPVEQISSLLELQRKMQPEATAPARDSLDDIRGIGELVRTLRDLGLVGEGGVSAEPAFGALLLETFNRYAPYVGPQIATLLRGVALWMTRQQGSTPYPPSMPVATTPGPELSAEEHGPDAQAQPGAEPEGKTIPAQLIPGVILQDVINRILPALQSESPDYERVWRVVSDYVPPYILDDLMGRMDHEVLGVLGSVDPRLADPTLQQKLIRLLEQGREHEEGSETQEEVA